MPRLCSGAICGEAKNAQEVLAKVQGDQWDLVILDLSMPGRSGLDVLRDINGMRPKLPILVLSMHHEDQYGKRILKAGASDYMNKESAPEELIKAIRKVLAGGLYVFCIRVPLIQICTRLDLAPDGAKTYTGYAGNQTFTKDPAGKWRKIVNDAAGRLIQVVGERIRLGIGRCRGRRLVLHISTIRPWCTQVPTSLPITDMGR